VRSGDIRGEKRSKITYWKKRPGESKVDCKEERTGEKSPSLHQRTLEEKIFLPGERVDLMRGKNSRSRGREDRRQVEETQKRKFLSLTNEESGASASDSKADLKWGEVKGGSGGKGKKRSPERNPKRWRVLRQLKETAEQYATPNRSITKEKKNPLNGWGV